MSCTFLPATVSPFCAMYSLAAASICLPVEAKGPVIGRIRPILKASCARAMPLAETRQAATAARINVLLSMNVSFECVSMHTVPAPREVGKALLFSARKALVPLLDL